MGAVSFSLDPRLVAALRSSAAQEVFVETGTGRGETVSALSQHFDELFTVEASKELWQAAAERIREMGNVVAEHAASPQFLAELAPTLANRATVYWLHAHRCVLPTAAGGKSHCQLLEEIAAISSLNDRSVILIDDARLFMAPPPAPHEASCWPQLDALLKALNKLSANHEVVIVNDVIVFFPPAVKAGVERYARTCGVDWLDITQRNARLKTENEDMNGQLLAKELCIQELSGAIAMHRFVSDYFPFLRPIIRMIGRASATVQPRIGRLIQHSPRPLELPPAPTSRIPRARAPKISIVTPSFRQGHFIERTLKSVLDQDYPNLEYFVEDGGSTDRTVEILRQYSDVLTGWRSELDTGQANAINKGFSRSSGDIMGWLNSDDILLPGSLDTVARFFLDNPAVDVVYGNRVLIDTRGQEIGRWILPGHSGEVLRWADYVPQETLFWRRRAWEAVGGAVDESFSFAMDWDLLVRFDEAALRFAHIPRFLGAFRVHTDQKTLTQMSDKGRSEMERVRKRTLGRVPHYWEIRKATMPFMLRHLRADMAYRLGQRLGREKSAPVVQRVSGS
jgi:hypothetical protein